MKNNYVYLNNDTLVAIDKIIAIKKYSECNKICIFLEGLYEPLKAYFSDKEKMEEQFNSIVYLIK